MIELFKYAITGINILPTSLLGLMILYWLIVIIGVFEFDFLDFDFDLNVDGADTLSSAYSLLAFFKVAGVPFMVLLSVAILNIWIIAMFVFYLPIKPGGFISGILLFPNFFISLCITKYELKPLARLLAGSEYVDRKNISIIHEWCTLICDVSGDRLGQAIIKTNGAEIVINVKAENNKAFIKGERAVVFSKDTEKDFYYIIK